MDAWFPYAFAYTMAGIAAIVVIGVFSWMTWDLWPVHPPFYGTTIQDFDEWQRDRRKHWWRRS